LFGGIRDLPTEAILRVDILPEEVSLKYGYRADQKVVNFVPLSRITGDPPRPLVVCGASSVSRSETLDTP
jgi:hypothetical protein